MKTAIGDADWQLLNVAQTNYCSAKREERLAIRTVAMMLAVSEGDAERLLFDGLLIEKLEHRGIEIYVQRNCQTRWPDTQTLGVWLLMAVGFAGVLWVA